MQYLSRRTLLAFGGAAAATGLALPGAAAVPGPLERPALSSRLASHSALLGLARAGGRIVAVGERGIVALSDDGGRSWRQAGGVPVSVTLTAVQFVDGRVGYAAGHYGVILKTEDAGERWSRLIEGKAVAERILQAARNASQGDPDAPALREAQRLVQEGPDKPWFALHFTDASRGMVVGAYNLALATEDGGRSWSSWSGRLPNRNAKHLYAIASQGDEIWLAGEQGLLLRSADAGRSFAPVPLPYEGSLFTVSLLSTGGSRTVVVAGLRGNAWRSANLGSSWERLAVPAPVSLTAAAVDRDGALYLANQAGHVFVSRDGGHSLAAAGHAATPQVASLLPLGDGSLLAAGWRGAGPVTALQGGTR